eukprot:gene56292-13971_t
MFCADYAASFIAHCLLTVGALRAAPALLPDPHGCDGAVAAAVGWRGDGDTSPARAAAPYLAGAVSGLVGACAVFPFDFVRRAVGPAGASQAQVLAASLSTVPYSAAFFGVYFANRAPRDLRSQACWGMAAATAAVAAEAPFDRAKRAMLGSRATVMMVNAIEQNHPLMIPHPPANFLPPLVAYDRMLLEVQLHEPRDER